MKKIILLFAILASFTVGAQEDCSKVEKVIDPKTGSTNYLSPGLGGITLMKTIDKKEVLYLVSVHFAESKETPGAKGVVLVFDNGQRIERPTIPAIIIRPEGSSAILHQVSFTPTSEEFKLLLEHKIVSKSVHTFTKDVLVGERLLAQFMCVIEK